MKCKNTRYDHECHPHYAKKYHGYCLDCANAGIDEVDERMNSLVEEIERLRKESHELRKILSALEWAIPAPESREYEYDEFGKARCPICDSCEKSGHASDCRLAKALCLPTGEKT